jgi:hypothetical protein
LKWGTVSDSLYVGGLLLVLELARLDLACGPFGCGFESVACLISPSTGVVDFADSLSVE